MNSKLISIATREISSKDAIMRDVLKSIGPLSPPSKNLCFENTARIIVNQQLSGKAANTIFSRVIELVKEFSPESIIGTPTEKLRECGLSGAKIEYIKALADQCIQDPNYITSFENLDDETAFSRIRQNKGFGDWSAFIFLLFHLKRPDVFPVGDATLNSAVSELYNVPRTSKDEILNIAQMWSPYKSVACLALWRWVDTGKPKTQKIT